MCGLLLINKPSGITSYKAVAIIKRLTGERHVGHAGTLDPMATGVLPVMLGRATKLCDYMLSSDKCYNARVRLGITTDTLDITGKVTSECQVDVTNSDIDRVLKGFLGESEQIPPMFSAIKKDGVRLYDLAREGKKVDISARKINVLSLERKSDIDKNHVFDISCRVSKGTYIRSLARDIGEALSVGATLTALCRSESAGFFIRDCVALEELNADNIKNYILPAESVIKSLRAVGVTAGQAFRFSNGGSLDFARLPHIEFTHGETVRVKFQDTFLGLAGADVTAGELKFKCIINPFTKEQ